MAHCDQIQNYLEDPMPRLVCLTYPVLFVWQLRLTMFKNTDISEGLAKPGHHQSLTVGGFCLSNLGHALGQFRRLNSWEHPGLRPQKFKNLFCQYGGCRLIMTKQVLNLYAIYAQNGTINVLLPFTDLLHNARPYVVCPTSFSSHLHLRSWDMSTTFISFIY